MMMQTSERKRILALLLLVFSVLAGIGALGVEALPSGYRLNWEPYEGAAWYDIYIDDVFKVRLPAGETSAEIGRLPSWTEHKISFAARNETNETLGAEFAHESTTGWDGFYRWEAPEGHDTNKGKLNEILYEVITKTHPVHGQYYEVWQHMPEGRMRLYPIMEFDDLKSGWTDFLSPEEHAVTYKVTSEKFNKSSILPKRWRINRFRLDYDMEVMTVETIATLGIRVETTQYFIWDIDDEGNREMIFYVDAPGFIKAFLTLCEEDYSTDGEFRLKEVR